MNEENEKEQQTSFRDTVKKTFKKIVAYLKVAKMEWIVMIALFALDLISKAIVNATTEIGQSVVLIPNFLNITNVHNYAAAFGSDVIKNALGSIGSRILFCIFAVAASVAFIIILIRQKGGHKLFRVALAMVTAGAMGNCIDRMYLGYVRDFIEFVYFGFEIWGQKSFWVFNFADSELVVGVIMIVVYFIFIYKEKDDKNAKQQAVEVGSDVVADTDVAETTAESNTETADTAEDNKETAETGEDSTATSDDAQTAEGAADARDNTDTGDAAEETTHS